MGEEMNLVGVHATDGELVLNICFPIFLSYRTPNVTALTRDYISQLPLQLDIAL